MKKLIVIMLCLLFTGCATVRNNQLHAGAAQFEQGNFKHSFRTLLPVAYAGNPAAQYAVGYMYYYGYGVPRDPESGEFWIGLAAKCGYPPAVMALKMISVIPAK